MDTTKFSHNKFTQEPAALLDDLESIRQLLDDGPATEPPLLTNTLTGEVQIPLLFDVVAGTPVAGIPVAGTPVASPPMNADVSTAHPEPAEAPGTQGTQPGDELLHLEADLRDAAQAILQDVINDFTPHIETEIKRRLDVRLERLLAQYS